MTVPKKIVGCVLLAVSVFACTPNQQPDLLTVGGPFEFTSQDPARNGYVYTRMQVAESLLEVNPAGELMPGLATEWWMSDDGLRWSFTLRDGVQFHDGELMTADSVVNALTMARRKPGEITRAPISEIRVDSPQQITVHLTRPFRPLGAIMAHFTSVILSPASYEDDASVEHMYGTGPYQIEAVDTPHRIEVRRFDEYWGEPASIPRAMYLTGHRAESRALQVMAGQTDIIYTLDPASLDMLLRRDDVTVHSETIPRSIQIKLNSSHPFMNDRDARLALSLAVDRRGIASSIIRVPGSEANQLVPPSLAEWHAQDLPPMHRDLAQARLLLAGLGWQAGPDGVLVRDNQRFEIDMVTYADRPELIVVATAIQAQWRELGIDLNVGVVNSSGIPGGHLDGTLDTALVARNYGNIADPLGVFIADYGDNGNGEWGAMGWSNATLPELFQQMSMETDQQRYVEMAQQVSRILVDELPVLPVIFYTQQTAVTQRVQGFTFDPYERNYRLSDMSFSQP